MSSPSARRVGNQPSLETRPRTTSLRVLGYAPWPPLACSAVYLLWLVGRFPRVVDAINLNPDASWAPVLARDLASGPKGGFIFVGQASHLTTIWFLMATRPLPFRDVIWDWAPFVAFLAGLGLIAWACWKAVGQWAALLSLSIGAAATPTMLLPLFAEGIHGHTFFADAVLAAFLVFHVTRWRDVGPRVRVMASVLMVLVAGTTIASDPLFIVSGLLPFWVTSGVLWFTHRTRRNKGFAALATVLAGSSVLLAAVIARWMSAYGFRKTYANEGYLLASRDQVVRNVKTFRDHLLTLGNGYFQARPAGLLGLGAVAMALFLCAAVVFTIVLTLRLVLKRRRDDGEDQPVLTYVVFWMASGLGVFGAFSLSTFAAGPSDTSRYVIPAFYALAATVPVLGRRSWWPRVAAAAGATLFSVLSIAGRNEMFVYREYYFLRSMDRDAARVLSFLDSEQVTRGYTGYLTSHYLTYKSDLKVHLYPVITCRQPVSTALCPFSVNTRTAWYQPERGVRSFVLFDAAGPSLISPAPPPDLGGPAAVGHFGDLFVFVYDYDVAARFAPGCPLGSAAFTCPPTPQ